MKKVHEFLDSLFINKKDTLVVAVSFGPDSMCLLDVLKNKYKNNKIVCAHVHHNHRKESDEEAKRLKEYCLKNDIIFEFMKIESYTNNKFTEEEARNKRYNFFENVMNKYNSNYLFTAHHGDDLIETVMMRIVRGSNLKGYSAINLISNRNGYLLVRPLLYLTKEDIVKYCSDKNIPYAVDETNLTNEQTRNRFRNNVLDFLKSENSNVHNKFLQFTCELNEYSSYVDKVVNTMYKKICKNNIIDIELLLKEEKLIINKILEKYLLDNYGKDINLLDKKHTKIINSMILNKISNMTINLPLNKVLVKSYNNLYFDSKDEYNDYCLILVDYLELPNKYIIRRVKEKANSSNYTLLLDSSEIKLPLYVRNRLDGDRMEVLNMNGTKKIKDILIDSKVDINERRNYPVVVDSLGNILWLPGIKKSKYDKSREGKYDIILEYDKEVYNDAKK